MKKQVVATYPFFSRSDPNRLYDTLVYADGTLSCNCPGWTRRVAADGTRTCKHVREVMQFEFQRRERTSREAQSRPKSATSTTTRNKAPEAVSPGVEQYINLED